MTVRVVIVDDHSLLRGGLGQVLAGAEGIEVVGEACNGREALVVCAEQAPDVVLMDIVMPVMDGVEATRRIAATTSPPRIVMLSSYTDRPRVLAALEAGAVGFVLKDAEPSAVVEAVRAAARGEAPIAPRVAVALLEARAEELAAPRLSTRERMVLRLVASGMPNKLIARELGIAEKTVKGHLTNLFREIGVTDRTQAALFAIRRGLDQPDGTTKG